ITGPVLVLLPMLKAPSLPVCSSRLRRTLLSASGSQCTFPTSPSGEAYATTCTCLCRSSWPTKRCTLGLRTSASVAFCCPALFGFQRVPLSSWQWELDRDLTRAYL